MRCHGIDDFAHALEHSWQIPSADQTQGGGAGHGVASTVVKRSPELLTELGIGRLSPPVRMRFPPLLDHRAHRALLLAQPMNRAKRAAAELRA